MLGEGKTRQKMRKPAHIQKQKDDIQREPSLSQPHQTELSPSLANGADSLSQMTPTAEPAPQSKPLQRQTMPQTMISYASGTPTPIQTKLRVGAANDRYEQEADQVADQVVGQKSEGQNQESKIQRAPIISALQRDGGESGFETNQEFDSNLSRANSGGSPLPDTIRREFEPKMGADLSQVRVHTGPDSASLNNQIQAKAFTHGRDIHFNAGQYQPNTVQGKRLLAHEVTHTIQQGAVQAEGGATSSVQREVIQRKKQEPEILGNLFDSEHAFSAFTEFAEKEYSIENVNCWQHIRAYKRYPTRSRAIKIYDTFLQGSKAPQEVNVSRAEVEQKIEPEIEKYRSQKDKQTRFLGINVGRLGRGLTSAFTGKIAKKDLFDGIESTIKGNLSDTYFRFRNEALYKDKNLTITYGDIGEAVVVYDAARNAGMPPKQAALYAKASKENYDARKKKEKEKEKENE